jgi:heme/copper-type cytochrome/quinol oxidase subunit 1
MGFAFHMISGFRIKIAYEKLARSQPYIYGLGMVLFISGLFVSGLFGAPRKTPGTDWTDNPVVLTALSFMGIGTLLAVIGGASFVVYIGVTVYREEKQDE